MSFVLFRPMDCKIISTLISFAASFVKILNASPGLSGTPIIDTRATSLSFAIPLINISSILFASLTIVPGFLVKLESTSNSTPYFFAISTERLFNTCAPNVASSNISS